MSSLYLYQLYIFILMQNWGGGFGDLRSEKGLSLLVWGCDKILRKSLALILPEEELSKVSLKYDKVCHIRYDAALHNPMSPISWFSLMFKNALIPFERNFVKNFT